VPQPELPVTIGDDAVQSCGNVMIARCMSVMIVLGVLIIHAHAQSVGFQMLKQIQSLVVQLPFSVRIVVMNE